jgi:sensor histidine kinase YesM
MTNSEYHPAKSDFSYYMLVVGLIAIIITLFDFHPDFGIWMTLALQNFILSFCIGISAFGIALAHRRLSFGNRWVFHLSRLLAWIIASVAGTSLGWFLNDLFFSTYRISHPFLFYTITGAICVCLAIMETAYLELKHQVRVTSEKLSREQIEKQQAINLKTAAELEALKAKVNPHFFFNTLNSIAGLIPTDPQKAEILVEKFSSLFRYPFVESGNEFIALSKELEFIRMLLEVEKIRFGNRLNYEVYIDPELKDVAIPPMLIQPLIENSLKHGISPLKDGGSVTVRCEKSAKDRFEIVVRDTGKGFDNPSTGNGFGIRSIQERLDIIYGDRHDFSITSENGTTVIIGLPIKNDKH